MQFLVFVTIYQILFVFCWTYSKKEVVQPSVSLLYWLCFIFLSLLTIPFMLGPVTSNSWQMMGFAWGMWITEAVNVGLT